MPVGDKIIPVDEFAHLYPKGIFTVSQNSPLQVKEMPWRNLKPSHFTEAKTSKKKAK